VIHLSLLQFIGTMTGDGEPARILLPYLQRADELQKHDHLVAYYCRLYAMEKGLKIPVKERTKETSALLTSLMNQLEKVHLSTSAAVCLSAIRLCMVLVVVAPIAGVKWLLNLTVYVFMQAL
jgi:hypothetical protein